MSRRNVISTSSVVELPNRIQITFGGDPRSAARKPKSLSLDTRTTPLPNRTIVGLGQAYKLSMATFWKQIGESLDQRGRKVLVEHELHQRASIECFSLSAA